MKLREIKIKNFRCFEDVTIPIDDTTILVGENNSGKTAILDALKIVLWRNNIGRTNPFDEYDYRLPSGSSSPQSCPGIELELWFREDKPDEWDDSILQDLREVIQKDISKDLNVVGIRLGSKYDNSAAGFLQTWEFLDMTGTVFNPKSGAPRNFSVFFEYCRLFYIPALRDAAEEFSSKSGYWSRILKDLKIDDATQRKLQVQLETLNKEILSSDARLERVRSALDDLQKIVALPDGKAASIQAVPLKPWDIMSKAEVVVKTKNGGADIPLTKHGQGVQSLSVLFLFQAYIDIFLKPQFRTQTEAIMALEEPEAHLHPQAILALASNIEKLKSQKIVSTHSPFFIQEISLRQIRLLQMKDGKSEIKTIKGDFLSPEDLKSLDIFCKKTRGEILFGRAWLLCEGQSEYLLLRYFAELLGKPLDSYGVSVIDFQNNGSPGAFVGLAESFSIPWVLICDNDSQCSNFRTQVEKKGIDATKMSSHFYPLPDKDFDLEAFLYKNGFQNYYISLFKETANPKKERVIAEWRKENKKNCTYYSYQVVQNTDGKLKVKYKHSEKEETIYLDSNTVYEEHLQKAIVGAVKTDKVTNTQRLIEMMHEMKVDDKIIPSFFKDRINEIIRKAGST